MSDDNLSYDALKQGLEQAEATLAALRRGEVDLVVGEAGPLLVRVKSLVEENERLAQEWQTTFNAVQSAIFLTEPTYTIVRCNHAAAELFGRPVEQMVGAKCYQIVHGSASPHDVCPLQSVSQEKKRQMMIFEQDGRWLEVSVDPVLDAIGNFAGTVHVVSDITERKRAEDALRETLADLKRSNADLAQFAYVASHDLQEPLRMVTNFVQLLADRYRGQLDADADEFIGYAVDGAKRMQQLIHDLLEYSRVGTRGQPLRPTDADVVLADVLWDLRLAIEDAGAVVTHDPLPVVLADPPQLGQLLQNLIGNAIKFRRSEPPRVHISAREAVEGAATSKVWEFAVRDNGIGIAPEFFERIFVIFQRLHSREAYPGTGIGLAICKKIVERHGGRIWVESAPGQGSTFYFTLPAA